MATQDFNFTVILNDSGTSGSQSIINKIRIYHDNNKIGRVDQEHKKKPFSIKSNGKDDAVNIKFEPMDSNDKHCAYVKPIKLTPSSSWKYTFQNDNDAKTWILNVSPHVEVHSGVGDGDGTTTVEIGEPQVN